MRKSLRQGMAEGIATEVVDGISAVRTNAHVIARITGCDLGKAYEAASELAVEGGEARAQVLGRYGHLNCAEIASTLANRPCEQVESSEVVKA